MRNMLYIILCGGSQGPYSLCPGSIRYSAVLGDAEIGVRTPHTALLAEVPLDATVGFPVILSEKECNHSWRDKNLKTADMANLVFLRGKKALLHIS